jgi:SAM-dependent methyltransferase/RimJ/RimL family protein N-acetyltransferase
MANPRLQIPGKRVTLRSTEKADLPALLSLWNDGDVMRWVGFPDGLGYDEAKITGWLARIQEDRDSYHFAVYEAEIGFCGEAFCRLDRTHRRGSLDIKFVPKARGSGRSRDALQTLIRWVFESLEQADAVWTQPSEENLAARTLYYSCGLRPAPRPADLPEYTSYWTMSRDEWRGGAWVSTRGTHPASPSAGPKSAYRRGSDYYARKLSAERLRACYDVAPPAARAYLENEIAYVLDRTSRAESILELGCGYGRVLRRLAHPRRRVVGIDNAPASLGMAREHLADCPPATLLAMDASCLAFRDGIFDLTICIQNGVSAFGVDPPTLFREAARVTRPGGMLLFSSYAAGFWEDRLAWFREQAAHGLVGEIDESATGNGVIICRDGFRATTVGPDEFARLAEGIGSVARIVEVGGSSLFCEITVA